MEFKEKPIKTGRITKVHGINGGMVVESDVSLDLIEEWPDWVFVFIDSGLVPFKLLINDCFIKDDKHLVIFLDRIDRPEKCNELLGKSFYLPSSVLGKGKAETLTFAFLVDYKVQIEGYTGNGFVTEFLDVPGNPLLRIDWNDGELLIPAQGEFVIELDEKKKLIRFNIPEGLIDLN
jgi:16S rRNA processing protein RimM